MWPQPEPVRLFSVGFLLVLLETQMPVVYFHLLEAAGGQCIIKIYILSPVKQLCCFCWFHVLLFYFVGDFCVKNN